MANNRNCFWLLSILLIKYSWNGHQTTNKSSVVKVESDNGTIQYLCNTEAFENLSKSLHLLQDHSIVRYVVAEVDVEIKFFVKVDAKIFHITNSRQGSTTNSSNLVQLRENEMTSHLSGFNFLTIVYHV